MQYTAQIAIRAHSDAIAAWVAADALSSAAPRVLAAWITRARQASAVAIDADDAYDPMTPSTEAMDLIRAASTDAEIEAAIEAHALAIVSLLGSEKETAE